MSHFLDSEAVYHTIGDEPVVDQFDVLYSLLQSGSIYDSYTTGSLLTKVKTLSGKEVLVAGNRGKVFNKLGVERNTLPSGIPSTSDEYSFGYYLQPWRERAGLIRNVKIFSSDERFYDSAVPNLVEAFKVLGGKIVKFDLESTLGLGVHNVVFFDNDAFNALEEDTGFSPVGFEASFPFEPIFSEVRRNRRLSDSFLSETSVISVGGRPTPVNSKPFRTKRLLIVELNSGSNFLSSAGPPATLESFNANYWLDNLTYIKPPYLFGSGTLETDTSKILFGFGDRRSIMLKSFGGNDYLVGRNNLVDPRIYGGSVASSYYLSYGPMIRGWKYGLIDGNPHYTSCVFRRDKFGQFRDMLEQRLNSVVISDEDNSPINYLGNVETPAMPIVKAERTVFSKTQPNALVFQSTFTYDSPVKIGFVRQTLEQGDAGNNKIIHQNQPPINTWSSNLSPYATSSLPYFDGISRNRTPLTGSPNSTILTAVFNFDRTIIS